MSQKEYFYGKMKLDIEKIKCVPHKQLKSLFSCKQEQAFPRLCNMKRPQSSILPKISLTEHNNF